MRIKRLRNSMKLFRLLFLLPLAATVSGCQQAKYEPKPLDPNVHYDNVYLLMGQSNATGVAQYSFLENSHPEIYQKYTEGNSKVLITYDTETETNHNFIPTRFGLGNQSVHFGPEIGMAETISQYDESAYIIKATYSGSCLQTEYMSTTGQKKKYYKRFVTFIKKQLTALEKQGKNPRVRGVFWMQGESDSFVEPQDTYYAAEKHFFESLRIDLNKWIYDHFNFVDAYIYVGGICWVHPEIINDCKQRLADENDHYYCIKTNGEDETAIKLYLKCETGEEDDLAHYDSKSTLLLGQTAGEYLVQ